MNIAMPEPGFREALWWSQSRPCRRALAVFLASGMAASITGAAIPVDGGLTAH
jgi:hypothetical protein